MKHLFWRLGLALAMAAGLTLPSHAGLVLCENDDKAEQSASQKIRVQIHVVADSSNSLLANVEAPTGTSARDLMDRLFKMSYADMTHRFVSSIAGFTANAKDKKFWKLEIDGKASEIGIAEVKIDKPMQIRWVMAEFK
jgi:hypothetical protein